MSGAAVQSSGTLGRLSGYDRRVFGRASSPSDAQGLQADLDALTEWQDPLVRPQLEYCASVWDPYTAGGVQAVERVQRRAARMVMNDYGRTSSVTEMLQKLQWPTLANRRREAQWNSLPAQAIQAQSVEAFRASLPEARDSKKPGQKRSIEQPTGNVQFCQWIFPRLLLRANEPGPTSTSTCSQPGHSVLGNVTSPSASNTSMMEATAMETGMVDSDGKGRRGRPALQLKTPSGPGMKDESLRTWRRSCNAAAGGTLHLRADVYLRHVQALWELFTFQIEATVFWRSGSSDDFFSFG
ncbi:hypothetical protein Bbelb_380890 [Branchiostoma belcheri]|nr:hypothetical protein Bbelb_380890 [Branchiostoma belcheri]